MEKFTKYISAIDGTQEWSDVSPLFDDLFHDDLVVVTANGELNREQWAEMAQRMVARHATASDFEITGQDGDAVFYQVTMNVGDDEPLHMKAKGTIRDGKLARVEPADPEVYSAMIDRSR